MKFTVFLHKKLIDILNDRRIVVWYDSEGDFKKFASSFSAPNCEVLFAGLSVLKARRRADEIYRLMNESRNPAEACRCLLIYVPHRRGSDEDGKMRDPFEVYALAGAAFGDAEDQWIESLARQAMPQKTDEITRLFREGRPDIALLDVLEETQRWPLLNELFRTETPADLIALALCDMAKVKAVDEIPGCLDELLRLFESAVGFKTTSEVRKWKTIHSKAAQYVLFSEFAFDSPGGVPEALSAVPRAVVNVSSVVYAACDRMRADTGLREVFMDLASKIEAELRLPEIMGAAFDPGERDTFPFEERRLLSLAVDHAVAGDTAAAQAVVQNRKVSVWRRDAQRSPAWTALERAAALFESAEKVSGELQKERNLAALVKVYVAGGWAGLDRCQRLFEAAVTSCGGEEVLSPLVELCRRRYRDTALAVQEVFLAAVGSEGWPPEGVPRQTRIFDEHVAPVLEHRGRIAFFLVDSLRYEMGRDLGEVLTCTGEVETGYAAAVLPTVTASGMAALMPGADGMLRLIEKDGGIVPALGTRLLEKSEHRMRLLSDTYGDRFFETTLDELLGSPKKITSRLKDTELLVVRTQDPDTIAENLGAWRARRWLSDVIGDIAAAVRQVVSLGFSRVVIAADHGHMMLPEIPAGDVVQAPPGGWLENKRRCRLGAGLSGAPGTITLKAADLGVQGDVLEICLPIGFRVFSDGEGYFHGGLSLQEAVVPVVMLRAARTPPSAGGKPEVDVRYRSDRFTTRVIGLTVFYKVMQMTTFGNPPISVRIEAYEGGNVKARLVGEAADCEARDEKSREVTLQANKETPVPLLIDPDFDGPEIEIRVSDPATRVVWARKRLKNAMMD